MAVMSRTELNRATNSRFNRAMVDLFDDRVVASTVEVPPGPGEAAVNVVYEFSRSLELRGAMFGGPYWELHAALFTKGQIGHDKEHCPDKNGPPGILTWEPAKGWATLNAISGSAAR